MANINEAYKLQKFDDLINKPECENNNNKKSNTNVSYLRSIYNWFKNNVLCCCRRRKTQLSPEAQHYLDNKIGNGPVPPHLLDELKKYKEENNLDIILTEEDAKKTFDEFNKERDNVVQVAFRKEMIKPYIDKKTGNLSNCLSIEARDFLLHDDGLRAIPPVILNELTEFRTKYEYR